MAVAQSLEDLLKHKDNILSQYESVSKVNQDDRTGMQTSDKSATLFDFIKMVHKLCDIVLKDFDLEFVPDENKILAENPEIPMDHPVITYKVLSRKPKGELKPRIRQTISEKNVEDENQRTGDIYGQKFECYVQFNIFASVYDLAEQVMERFEEMIFAYTGYMKKNGIGEILFSDQLTDTNFDLFRQTISVRNLRFYVEVEKLYVIFTEKIKEIETLGL